MQPNFRTTRTVITNTDICTYAAGGNPSEPHQTRTPTSRSTSTHQRLPSFDGPQRRQRLRVPPRLVGHASSPSASLSSVGDDPGRAFAVFGFSALLLAGDLWRRRGDETPLFATGGSIGGRGGVARRAQRPWSSTYLIARRKIDLSRSWCIYLVWGQE